MEEEQSVSKGETDWLQPDDLPTSFAAATKELASLGALSIDEFLSNVGSASSMYDILFSQANNESLADPEKEGNKPATADDVVMKEEDIDTPIKANKSHVSTLRTMAQNVFGSSECLKWEFLENDDDKQCILTITRPNGVARSYKSSRGFARRQEARADASQIAVEMGALEFIVSGDADALKAKKGLLLNPFDVEVDRMEQDEVDTDSKPQYLTEEEPLQQIAECCDEWRAGRVKPHWVAYNDSKNKTKKRHGAALRISLNPHVFRAYSVDPMYDTVRAARIACAKVAIDQGVIDFLQYGNGQLEPAKVIDDGVTDFDMDVSPDYLPSIPAKGISLQDYYESLPQPFPEDVGQQTASEINAPAWLNMAIQSARGGRLVLHFTPIADSERHLHGTILRVQRPGETRTYLVDPMFGKRGDAKAAVCLLAMSQGVGDYIRGLKEEAENKLPADKRKLANEKILQVLSSECTKIRPGSRLIFVFQSERDAFGCTIKADISEDESTPDVREYTVPVEYRTKADAKAAVACLAAEQGLVDVLRFKGAPLPPDYIPFWVAQQSGDGDQYVPKRKEHDRDDDRDRRKRRKGNNSDSHTGRGRQSQAPTQLPSSLPVGVASLPPKPVVSLPANTSSNSRWKKLPVSGSRGLDPPGAFVNPTQSGGQDRSGNRNGSDMYHNREARPPNATSYDNHPPYTYGDRGGDHRTSSAFHHSQSGYGRVDSYGSGYPSYPHAAPTPHYGPPPPVPPPGHHYPGYYVSPPPAGNQLRPHDPYGHYPPPPLPPPHHHQPPPHPPYVNAPYIDPRYVSPPPHPHTPHDYPRPHNGYPHPDTYDSRYPRSPPHFAAPSTPHHGYHEPHSPYPPDHNSRATSRPGPDYGQRYPDPREPGWRSPNGNGYQGPETQQRRQNGKQDISPPVINPPLRWGLKNQPSNQNNNQFANSNVIPLKQEPVAPTQAPPTPVKEPIPAPPVPVPTPPEPVPAPPEPSTPAPPLPGANTRPETNRAKLTDFCVKESIPTPKFFYEAVADANSKTKYKVWAEKDSHRLELQTRFDSVDVGYEKLSKKVLEWELGRMKIKT